MTKIAVMTDSNSGITQKEAEKLGVSVLPMPFIVNGETFFEDITLTREQFYEHLKNDADVSTSQPSPESVLNMWDELLKEYDEVVHIPMSSGLSGSCQTAMMLANDYDGRVQVVDNQRISVTLKQSVLDALKLSKQNKSAKEIREILEADKGNSSIYLMLDTLHYLKKGGRITPAAAALGTLLKLKPVLQTQGDKLDAFAKARTITQAKSTMINAMKNDINERLGGMEKCPVTLYVVHTENSEAAEQFKQELLEVFPVADILIDNLSLSVACHVGPGGLAIAAVRNLGQ